MAVAEDDAALTSAKPAVPFVVANGDGVTWQGLNLWGQEEASYPNEIGQVNQYYHNKHAFKN